MLKFVCLLYVVVLFGGVYSLLVDPIYEFPEAEKTVALTFNKGPHGSLTPLLLDILNSSNVKASFFVAGKRVELHPEVILRAKEEGHDVGSTVYDFSTVRKKGQSLDDLYGQVMRTNEILHNITGTEPEFIRFPNMGSLRSNGKKGYSRALVETKFPIIMWSLDSFDLKQSSSKDIVRKVVSRVKSGSIILFHDIQLRTVEAMPEIIDQLTKDGYSFKSISQLLKSTPLVKN